MQSPRARAESSLQVAVQRIVRTRSPSERALRQWARCAARSGDVTLRIVGPVEAKRLNARYRGRDAATNVLSFSYVTPGSGVARRSAFGDIVLCHAVIVREAREHRKPLDAHYAHLVIHGVLHLRGYTHARPREAVRMERFERRLLRGFGFPDPYAVQPRRAR